MQKVIVEVRINESVTKAVNPRVPSTAAEIATDGRECVAAGAAIIHFHPRDAQGARSYAYADYCDTIVGLREVCDALIHPTIGPAVLKIDARERLATVLQLAADGARPDLVPVGMAETTEGLPYGEILENPLSTIRDCITLIGEAGIASYWDTWNLAAMRRVASLLTQGLSPIPPLLMLSMLDAKMIVEQKLTFGHPAGPKGLQELLDLLPPGAPCHWAALHSRGNLLPLIPQIVANDGHISIGLGDYDYPELGQPTNADVVSEVARRVRDCGAEVASPGEALAILGLDRLRARVDARHPAAVQT